MTSPRHLAARPRDDLPWLRRRTLRTAVASGPTTTATGTTTRAPAPAPQAASRPAPPPAPPASAPPVPTTRPAPTAAGPGTTSLDLSAAATTRTGGDTSLDLSAAATTPRTGGDTSLDLSAPASAHAPVPAPASGRAPDASTSLDLSTPARTAGAASSSGASSSGRAGMSATAGAAAVRERPPRPSAANGDAVLCYTPRRAPTGRPVSLTASDPTVALTRVQSGVGALTVRAVVPAAVGDLRLAVAYQLASGESSLLSAARGVPVAPRGSRRPVLTGAWEGQETLRVDLRQVTALERLVVVAFSQSGVPLAWGGALVVETFGKARVDLALDHAPAAGVLVALSIHNVAGELVLRAEDELLPGGTLRDAALAYGFDRITWVDPWTPLG